MVTRALLLGYGIGSGVPLWALAALVVGSVTPGWGLVGVGLLLLWTRPERLHEGDVAFYNSVASELRGGAGLRSALARSGRFLDADARRRLERLTAAGRPMVEVAGVIEAAVPRFGVAAGSAVRVSGRVGGRAADVFASLARAAAREQELDDEIRSASAHGRLSALIIGGIPLLLSSVMVLTGRTGLVADSGAVGLVLALAGWTLIVTGVTAVFVIVRRSRQ